MCVEKLLGEGEKISMQKESLVAFQESVRLTNDGPVITAEGPGFVFISTAEIMKNHLTYGRIILGVVLIMMIESFLGGFWLNL